LEKELEGDYEVFFFFGGGGWSGTSVSGASNYIECVTPIGTHRPPSAYTHTAKKYPSPRTC
jgi:hypothetical protein